MRKIWFAIAVLAACSGGLEPGRIFPPRPVGLGGTVRFPATFPNSTENVFMAAYVTFPQPCPDLINNRQPFTPSSVPYPDSIASYSVELPAGTYHWVLAVWKKEGTLTLTPADTAL